MSDWPCNLAALDSARAFIRDAASKGGKVVLAPDRDADGLCAGKMSCSNLANLAPDRKYFAKLPLCLHFAPS